MQEAKLVHVRASKPSRMHELKKKAKMVENFWFIKIMNDELTILRKNIRDTEKKFQDHLEKFLGNVEKIGANAVSLYAGTLYRQVEGDEIDYVKLVLCTSIMRQFLQSGDEILNEPDDADIRYFQIEYKFPRKSRKFEK